MKNHSPSLLPPPSPGTNVAIDNKTNSELDDLRERLRRSEEQAQQNYDEMKEYQSWLEQVEEGQGSLKDSEAPEFDPVPDNPPGLWERKDGKDISVANSDIGQDGKDWVTRISRKEHEKVTVKQWPKCQDLDVWRSNVVQSVCVASGDPDTAAWRRWLSPALLPDPDYAGLADSGEFRFQSIDSKLSIALQNMVDAAGETASEVKVRIRQRSQVLGKEGNFLMGREILAMVLDHFRTTSQDEVLFNASHIYKLQYRGDKEMDKFLHAWIEIIANMKTEDIPSDNTLRDHLLRKIDGSQALHVDLTIFKGRDNDDKKKSYHELLEIMRRHIARAREDRNIAARDKFATDYTNLGKPSTPAPKPTAPTPTPKDGKPGKPSAPAPKGKPGAPVLPSGNPKSHGKGKGKGGKRSRSPSTRDPSKTFCHFHFNKGNCKHGDKCQYSHSQYHWDKRKDKGGKGKNGRSTTPRRSQTPGGKKDRHCYGWLKGDCQKGDKCTFKHDPNMKGKRAAPSTKTSDAKAAPALIREANMTKSQITFMETKADPGELLAGLEASMNIFHGTTRSTTTPNSKRGGSRVTEPTNYEEALVNQILRDIPMYHGLQHACLIGEKEISVINENYKRSKAGDTYDENMEPEGQGNGDGSSTTPGPTTEGVGASAEGRVDLPPRTGTKHPSLHPILRKSSKYLRTKVPSSRPSTRSLPWRTTTMSASNVVQVVIPTMIVLIRVPIRSK